MTLFRLFAFSILVLLSFTAKGQSAGTTYVFVHGAWSNSTLFKGVDSILIRQGDLVYRPTLTGLGERRHLNSSAVSLTTHITDVVNVIETEQLQHIVLVGHSYAGMVISGVAERLPGRIDQLVYIDAFVPNNGESVFTADNLSAASKASLRASVEGDFINMPVVSIKTQERQSLKTFTETLTLTTGKKRAIPTAYILMVPPNTAVEKADFYKASQRAKQRGWLVRNETGYHADLMGKPAYLATLLQQLSGSK